MTDKPATKSDGKSDHKTGSAVEHFEEPGDVNDIKQQIPSISNLNDLKELLKNVPTEQLNQLLKDFSKENKINPDESYFSTISKENITKARLRNKIKQMKNSRTSRVAIKSKDEKMAEKMKEKMKQFESHKDKVEEKKETAKKEAPKTEAPKTEA